MDGFVNLIYQQERTGYGRAKQSYNLLTGYQRAVETARDKVFMIEEDIMIATDFFTWHYKVHEAENNNLFCSIATANNNRDVPVTDRMDSYYLTHGDYQSLGVCFNKKVLIEEVLPLAVAAYYTNSQVFCQKEFPNSKIGRAYTEQDGLIRRVQEHQDKLIAFPHVARAYHSGFIGYNRQKNFNMELVQKIEYIRSIIFSDQRMREVNFKNPDFYKDSKPINLDNPNLDYDLVFNQPEIKF
jgi:hypothetical protein